MPTLLETEDGRVDSVTYRQTVEVLAEVHERHPVRHTAVLSSGQIC